MNKWESYKNGNYMVMINTENGTKIRETNEDEFIPEFAENMDIKISNYCNMGCSFCHEGSSTCGKHADLNQKFVDTLHPYQEVALGGGDVTSHPELIPFLEKLKEKQIIANITVNQKHFEEKQELINKLVKEKLIHGLGVSLVEPTQEFVSLIKQYPNAVIHVINGILRPSDIEAMKDQGLKMLILGYKYLRRGEDYWDNAYDKIKENQNWLKKNIKKMIDNGPFKVLSFDNLALEQLDVRSLMDEKQWEEFYMGDDGTSTYYIDMVEKKFARSSTALMDKRYPILDSVDEMFKVIRKENK